jgi:aspartate carbamoyltransferase catalytic subunit
MKREFTKEENEMAMFGPLIMHEQIVSGLSDETDCYQTEWIQLAGRWADIFTDILVQCENHSNPEVKENAKKYIKQIKEMINGDKN